ncbi:MAG: DALR domain-containing protein, partial [Nitrososphaera sp.]
MNTSLALTEFLKLVTQLNQYAAADKLAKDMAEAALPAVHKIMDILGLKAIAAGKQEREDIEKLVDERNRMRAEKKFKEADEIRKKLLERSVELLDHKGRTVWVKRERPE